MLTTLFLSRLQFAITISFHILFPAFSIGLATYLLLIETLWLTTKKKTYYQTARFWTKILALTFGMGIVSGLAMQFQIGTNWSGFSTIVGPVLGVLFTLEALTAFFIEATFLGIMLFAWHFVPKWLHYLSTWMVFIGVSVSAFWILSANSWMQTPAGVIFNHHHFVVTSWYHVIFNPSTVIRYIHMLLAAYLATACVILAVASYYLVKKHFNRFARLNFSLATIIIALTIPLQIIIGDEVGYKMHTYQPVKTAAIEGLWHGTHGAPLVLAAWIDQQQQKNSFEITIPHVASILNTHHYNGYLQGLTSVKPADQPEVIITFYSFRIMVGIGILLLAISWILCFLIWRKSIWRYIKLLKSLVYMAPLGFIALLTGWYTAETGRQPWVVYNYVRTSQGVSHITSWQVLLGFIIILVIYGLVFGIGYMGYFIKSVKKGPIIPIRKRRP